MNVAVVGGGINGIMTTWGLLKQGHDVTLFDKGEVMQQTSSASTKLLHGGLRYLENFEFRLVKEALEERQWWIEQAPRLAHPLKLYIPVYRTSRRPAWMVKMGLWLYGKLAGKQNIGQYQSLNKQQIHLACPQLKSEGLIKGFSFFDGQMDDYQLGLWALEQAKKLSINNSVIPTEVGISQPDKNDMKNQLSLIINEHTQVTKIDQQGKLTLTDCTTQTFDKIINIAGPWAEQLLKQSNIKSEYTLNLVCGSHILVENDVIPEPNNVIPGKAGISNDEYEKSGYLLEIPNERRIFFVLPYQGKILIGTTEVPQNLNKPIQSSEEEIDYLINAYNYYFTMPISKQNIIKAFAGLRPLIKSAKDPSKATREYAIHQNQKIINVFGGKWTTSRELAKKVAEHLV